MAYEVHVLVDIAIFLAAFHGLFQLAGKGCRIGVVSTEADELAVNIFRVGIELRDSYRTRVRIAEDRRIAAVFLVRLGFHSDHHLAYSGLWREE